MISRSLPPSLTSLPTAFADGRYQLLSLLGEGSKKWVYLARDTRLNREVALALFKPNESASDALLRVQREARALALLGDHPHIVTLYDLGEEHGQPYFISQYMAGGTLQEQLRRSENHRLSLEDALQLTDQLCQALAYAHQHGILHRDLKPSNVWFTEGGVAKLGDFGLAASLDHSRFTLEGVLIGTAAYLPPEQLQGHKAEVRSDLYSLGAMLYEMLTGRPPFVGDTLMSLIVQHLNSPPVAPSHYNPTIPSALDTLILQLLAKTPEERPESAVAVQALVRPLSEPTAPIVSSAPPLPVHVLDRLATDIFVGREREMDELRANLEEVLMGRGRMVTMLGEPGIGKTRLATELATFAKLRGARVLVGRCHEDKGAPPYWPWVQIIRSFLKDYSADLLRTAMGIGAGDIAQVIPEVRDYWLDLPTPPSLAPEQARFRFFDSVTTFLKNVAQTQPLVLLFDDLQWADSSSLLLLQFVAQEIGAARVLLLVTCREVEAERQPPLTQTLSVLARTPGGPMLHLHELSEKDVTRFIELTSGQTPTPEVAAAVFRETEGHPFFMMEVVRLLTTEARLSTMSRLPQGVRSVIAQRLEHLSKECRWILTIAAVIGREFSLSVLARVNTLFTLRQIQDERQGTSMDDAAVQAESCHFSRDGLVEERALLVLLDEALAARLITLVPHRIGYYSFSHALIRDTLYEELTTHQRFNAHRAIGEAFEALAEAHQESFLTELAHHFFQAAPGGAVEKAMTYAQRAAERATATLAYEEAAVHYEHALQLLPMKGIDERVRSEFLLALGEAQRRTGNIPQAKETFLRAVHIARAQREWTQLARAALGFAGLWVTTIGIVDPIVVSLLEETLHVLPAEDDVYRAKVLARLARELWCAEPRERRVRLSQEAVALARRSRDPQTLAYALDAKHLALWGPENLTERLATATEIVRLAEESGDHEVALQGHNWRVTDLLELGDIPALDAEIQIHTKLAETLRLPTHLWNAAVWKGMRAVLAGQFAEAEILIPQALASGQRAHIQQDAALTFGIQMFALRREQGRLEELEAAIRKSEKQYPGFPIVRYWLMHLACELEREEEVRERFEQLSSCNFMDLPQDMTWLLAVTILAHTCVFLGDKHRAAVLYDILRPYAELNVILGSAMAYHDASYYPLALLATLLERWENARSHFEDALRRNAQMGARPRLAQVQYSYASMLFTCDLSGDREKAEELLDQALATAKELGMVGLIEKIQHFTFKVDRSDSSNQDARDHQQQKKDASYLTRDLQQLSVPPLISPAQLSTTRPQNSPSPASSLFRYEGEYWTIAYEGMVLRLKDTAGLRYLAQLLRHPEQEFHVLDLVENSARSGAEISSAAKVETARLESPHLHDVGEVLGSQARTAYKQRVKELQAELTEAEEFHNLDRIERLREELELLTQELTKAIGLGGRDRKAAAAAERARVNVTRAIKAVFKKIAEQHPVLALYLSTTVKTGTFCSYSPDPRIPVSWEF